MKTDFQLTFYNTKQFKLTVDIKNHKPKNIMF